MQKTYEFKKIKLIAGGEKLLVKMNENGDISGSVQAEYNDCPHQDLINAVDSLRYHLPLLCDFIEEAGAKVNPDLEKYVVTGLSIAGKPGKEGIVITGYRKTYSGKAIAINTPLTRLEQSEDNNYPYLDELLASIKKIGAETRLYLFNGKKMSDNQLPLEFDADKATHAKVLPAMNELDKLKQATVDAYNRGESPDPLPAPKPKPAGKKKVAQSAENKSGEVDA